MCMKHKEEKEKASKGHVDVPTSTSSDDNADEDLSLYVRGYTNE